jgi:DNA-binding IclR family transcriptional regulator
MGHVEAAMAAAGEPLTALQIADRVGWSRSTVYKHLSALQHLGRARALPGSRAPWRRGWKWELLAK